LPSVLLLNNSGFEVVAVDDFSQDSSFTVLGVLKCKHKNLRFSSLNQETRYSEKMAQNIALKAARHDWVMVIPPSVNGVDSRWLSTISSRLGNNNEVVVNYSNLKANGRLYNILYRSESFFQQLKSFGFILNGLSFINFEENVAFKKEKYFEAGGFKQKINEPYANLELIINTFINKKKTHIIFSSSTVLRKEIPVNRIHFMELIKKELHVRKHLPFLKKFIIVAERIVTLLFLPVSVLVFLFIPELLLVLVVLLIAYLFAFSLIIKISLDRLNERKLFLSSLIVGMLMPYFKLVYQVYFYYFSRKRKWRSKI